MWDMSGRAQSERRGERFKYALDGNRSTNEYRSGNRAYSEPRYDDRPYVEPLMRAYLEPPTCGQTPEEHEAVWAFHVERWRKRNARRLEQFKLAHPEWVEPVAKTTPDVVATSGPKRQSAFTFAE